MEQIFDVSGLMQVAVIGFGAGLDKENAIKEKEKEGFIVHNHGDHARVYISAKKK